MSGPDGDRQGTALRPIAETDEALTELERYSDDPALRDQLLERGRMVRAVVPACVGLSITVAEEGLTFTLVASDQVIAALDAAQYLDGGPCLDVSEDGGVESWTQDQLLDEGRWRLFAMGTAASGVASTLTLPLRHDDEVVGSVNLYAATADAFDGHHEEVAAIFGAWAEDAIANADLGFTTRRTAQEAPRLARESALVALAVGIVAERAGVDPDEALRRLGDAAARAGLTEVQFARYLVEAVGEDEDPGTSGSPGADADR